MSWGRIPLALFVASIPQQIRFNFAYKEAMIALHHGHDQAAIGPRSRGDRASIVTFLLQFSIASVHRVLWP